MSSPVNVELPLRPLPSVSMYQAKWANSYVWCWRHRRVAVRSRRSTIVLKFGSKAPLKKLRNLSLSIRRGPLRFWSLLRGLDWLKLESRCLEDVIGMSSEHQKLYRELWGCLLLWGNSKGVEFLCLARFQCFISSSRFQGLVHRHLYCWTLEMMIQIARLQF